jgi:carbonic anhydrase
LAAGATLSCPLCAISQAARAASAGPHWSYHGTDGPEHWSQLTRDFAACSAGTQQSPIDLAGAFQAALDPVEFAYGSAPLKVVNNGHTIQVDCPDGHGMSVGGEGYKLLQFHFHHPSEHRLDGRGFDLEWHFVHRSQAGRLAVLGVFASAFVPGGPNDTIEAIWRVMPAQEGEAAGPGTIDLNALLPRDRRHFLYHGSLTTPPCGEGVDWRVFREPMDVSRSQVQRFAQLFPLNARPVQPVNRRFLLRGQ